MPKVFFGLCSTAELIMRVGSVSDRSLIGNVSTNCVSQCACLYGSFHELAIVFMTSDSDLLFGCIFAQNA